MDVVKQFLEPSGVDTARALAEAGFNSEQAQRFILEAIRDLVAALPTQNLAGLLNADGAQQASRLLGLVDIGSLAARPVEAGSLRGN